MAQKWVDQTGSNAGRRNINVVHLSDGTAVWIESDGAVTPTYYLCWSSDHSTVNILATLSSSFLNPVVAVDNNDNIFVVGSAPVNAGPTNSLCGQAFTKGTGYTWTAQSFMSTAGVIPGQSSAFNQALWCNTGGGTGGLGHLLVFGGGFTPPATWVSFVASCDVGAMLTGAGVLVVGNSNSPACLNINPYSLVSNGFGATSGLVASWDGATTIHIGAWTLDSTGALTANTAVGTVTDGWQGPILISYAPGQYVHIGASSITGHYIAHICTSAAIGAGVDCGTPTGLPFSVWFSAYKDISVTNRVWLIAQGAVNGSGYLDIHTIEVDLGTGTPVWGTSSIPQIDTLDGVYIGNFPQPLIAVQQPVKAIVDFQVQVNVTSSTIALYGDYVVAASAPSLPTLISPPNGSYVDVSPGVGFLAKYNSTDNSDQNAYALRIRVGAGAYNYWNAGTGALQGTIVWNPIATPVEGDFSVTVPTGILSNGNTYGWSFASQESLLSFQGNFATDFQFVAQAGPTLVVTAPVGVAETATPPVRWITTPAAGDVQTHYRVVVYSADQYSIGGFTPGTSPSTWDSGVMTGGAQSLQVGTTLTNATAWRAYVQVTQTGGQTSGWVSTSFTTAFDAPAQPTIVAAATTDPSTGCPMIQLTVVGQDNILSVDDASFESSLGTWTPGTNTTLSQVGGVAIDGAYCMAMEANLGLPVSAQTGHVYVVQPNLPYTSLVSFRAAGSEAGVDCTVVISWYDSGGSFISSSAGSPKTDGNAAWTQWFVQATAPSNAAFASIGVSAARSIATEKEYVDRASLHQAVVSYQLNDLMVDGALAQYPLTDLASSATVTNNGPSGGAGTVNGKVTLGVATDFPGGLISNSSALFDGSTGYISTSFNPTSGVFTVKAFVLINHAQVSRIVSNHNATGHGFYIGTDGSGYPVFVVGNGTVDATVTAPASVADGQWHQIVGVYDGSNVYLYIDGVAVAGPVVLVGSLGSGVNTKIGRGTSPSNYFSGNIAMVSFVPSALSSGTIAAEYTLATTVQNMVIRWTAGGFLGFTAVQVIRSDGVFVRGASTTSPALITNTLTQKLVLNDYEITPTVIYSYQAYVVDTANNLVGPSSQSEIVIVHTTQWWELDPTNPASAVNAQFLSFQPQVTEQSTARLVMGQPTPNMIANVMGANDGAGTIEIFDAGIYAKLQNILQSQKTIFLMDPWGDTYGPNGPYVRFGPQTGGMSSGMGNKTKDSSLLPSSAAGPHRTINVTWVAQPRPKV